MPYSPAMTARNRPSLGFSLATVLLCLPLVAGCGSDEPKTERLAFCQGHSDDDPGDGMLDVEFRQGSTVVAQGSVNVGMVFSAEVPWGGVKVYVDDVYSGSMNEGVPTNGAVLSPTPKFAAVYMSSGEGCPQPPVA
jgi:hypothetical protein